MHAGFWWGKLREGDGLEGISTVGRIMLKQIFMFFAPCFVV